MTRKIIKGSFFHEIEELSSKKYERIGFKDEEKRFGEMFASLVPEISMEKKAGIMVKFLGEGEK